MDSGGMVCWLTSHSDQREGLPERTGSGSVPEGMLGGGGEALEVFLPSLAQVQGVAGGGASKEQAI